jgi:hypothetical protein
MALVAPYFDLVREMKKPPTIACVWSRAPRGRGIKPTARLFAITVSTVRKRLRGYP